MNEQKNGNNAWEHINLGSVRLKKFFLKHLDRIYGAKEHLVKKLPELLKEAEFNELRKAIENTVYNVEKQIARMQLIYTLLDSNPNHGSIHGVSGLIDDAFEAINEQIGDAELQDLSIIFYLQNIESIEMSSFQILQMAAIKLHNPHINKLLKDNYDEARSDRTLLLLISSKYIVN
ncbi:DUF892 family protein [Pedobacter aquatilis]|uniref:DUF892 family protein n=1 Tax=Pedobacter aquatilis TaxID=351343 RepID=UPI00292F4362|nr:DUF892 family protein [Pedobacter aquatilis]